MRRHKRPLGCARVLFVIGAQLLLMQNAYAWSGPEDAWPALPRPESKWLPLSPPPERVGHSAILDPRQQRLIIFGGARFSPWVTTFDDVWSLALGDGTGWTQIRTTGDSPTAREAHCAIYDPIRARMLVFGGAPANSDQRLNEVWALSLDGTPEWVLLNIIGEPPEGLIWPNAIYDPVDDRMIIFGGQGQFPTRFNDVWALNLSGSPSWERLFPTGTPPSPRQQSTAIFDSQRRRMIVLGGFPIAENDVWALSLDGNPAWTELTPIGTPPTPLFGEAVYDAPRDRMVVFGGYPPYSNGSWALSLQEPPMWTAIAPSGELPDGRAEHSVVLDPVSETLIVFAGCACNDGRYFNDTWALALDVAPAWSRVAPRTDEPRGRQSHTMVFDANRNRGLLFGGRANEEDGIGGLLNDVWALSEKPSVAWSELFPSGPAPSARYEHAAAFDPPGQQMIVFGGSNGPFLNDVWSLRLSGAPQWAQLEPGGPSPSERVSSSLVHDESRNRMILFGGYGGVAGELNDTWVLELGESPVWTQLSPVGTPPPARFAHSAIFEPKLDRMIIFGGSSPGRNDVWELSFAGGDRWTQILPSGTPPPGVAAPTAVLDPLRNRMIVYGGYADPPVQDPWALLLGTYPEWVRLTPGSPAPADRSEHAAIYDEDLDRMIVYAGASRSDTWALAFTTKPPMRVDTDRSTSLSLVAQPQPNPFHNGTALRFDAPSAGTVRLDVFDVTGRHVRTLTRTVASAGTHEMRWFGEDDSQRRLPAGNYFFRLLVGNETLTRRVTLY